MAVTNEQIILAAQIQLAADGKISVDDAGNMEPIHTFQFWKANGFIVRKGEKALVELSIWKLAKRKKTEDEEEDDTHFFLKRSHFFSRSQVVPA